MEGPSAVPPYGLVGGSGKWLLHGRALLQGLDAGSFQAWMQGSGPGIHADAAPLRLPEARTRKGWVSRTPAAVVSDRARANAHLAFSKFEKIPCPIHLTDAQGQVGSWEF